MNFSEPFLTLVNMSVTLVLFSLGSIIAIKLKDIYSKFRSSVFIGTILFLISTPVAIVRILTTPETTQYFVSGYLGFIGIFTMFLLMAYAPVATSGSVDAEPNESDEHPYR